jgi:hypothetical protein
MYLCDHKQDKFIDMKIMIIDGGPRKTMNTAAMIEKFSEGVKSVDKAIEGRIPPPHLCFLLLPCFLNGFLVAGEGSEGGELRRAVVHAHPGMPL